MKRKTARASAPLGPNEIGIDNFNFTPPTLTVKAGTTVSWINTDDVPHLIVNVQNKFKQSAVLDTDQSSRDAHEARHVQLFLRAASENAGSSSSTCSTFHRLRCDAERADSLRVRPRSLCGLPMRARSIALLVVAGLLPLALRPPVNPNLYSGLVWRNIGPFRGGRVSAVTGVIGQPGMFYIGLPLGGVWQTTGAGTTWYPIFDDVKEASSVGSIQVAPSDPNIIYVGMGDLITGGGINEGNGVYKSTDAGKTWKHLGLDDTKQIPSILVDPKDPNLVLRAAQGNIHTFTHSRGVFRSTDGGVRVSLRPAIGGVGPGAVADAASRVATCEPVPARAAAMRVTRGASPAQFRDRGSSIPGTYNRTVGAARACGAGVRTPARPSVRAR